MSSYNEIKKNLEQGILDYSLNKKSAERDALYNSVADAFQFIDEMKVFDPNHVDYKHEFSVKIREELFPLLMEAQFNLPKKNKYGIGDVDYEFTGFIKYLPQSYLSYIPKGGVKNIKVSKVLDLSKPFNPFEKSFWEVFGNWVNSESWSATLRPALTGVYFDEFGVTGTNAHILLHLAGERAKDVKLNTIYDRSKVIDAKFPNYQQVSNILKDEILTKIDCQIMLNALETLISNACVNSITNQIVVKKGDRYFGFNAEYLAINFKAWLQLGVPMVNFWNHQNEYEYNRVAVLFTDVNETLKEQDKMSYSLVMPTFLRDDVENYETYIEIVDENNIDVVVDGSPAYRFSSGGSGQKSNNNQIKKEVDKNESIKVVLSKDLESHFMDVASDGEVKYDLGMFDSSDEDVFKYLTTNKDKFIAQLEYLKSDLEHDIKMEKETGSDYDYLLPLLNETKVLLAKYSNNKKEASEKEQTQLLIDELREALEFMDAEEKQATKELIVDLREALQFMDVDFKKKPMNDDLTEKPIQYTYLMTLGEYNQSGVMDLLKEYRKFIKHNIKYLANAGWGDGFDFLTYNEAIELGKNSPFYVEPSERNYQKKNITENIKHNYHNKITNYDKIKIDYVNTPKDIVEKNKDFRKKIMQYFPIDKYKRLLIDVDEMKSNKRAIKNAMDNNVYYDLIKNGELSIDRLEEITQSVGVRITQNTYKADKGAELKEYLNKIKVPQHNFQVLLDFGKQIKSDLQKIKDLAYEKEYNRYAENIKESIGKTLSEDRLSLLIPFWYLVVDADKETIKTPRIYNGRTYYDEKYQYTILSLKSDWEKQLDRAVKNIVEELMFKIVVTIIKTITFVKIPFKSVITKDVKIGVKGFEGVYEINFTDGSKFDLVTQGIGAGGKNIQAFHYRYISKIENRILPNGETTKSDSHFTEYKIVNP